MKLVLDYTTIANFNLDHLVQQFPDFDRHVLNDTPGNQFYKLYAYIANYFGGVKIADIGARHGHSAVALSYNPNSHVDSYEIYEEYYNILTSTIHKSNISFYDIDILTDPKILEYPLISLDVDPHDGIQEAKCFNYLIEQKYDGVVLLDDIQFAHVYPALAEWWNSITLPKWNVTRYGHYSGTGLVDFSGKLEVILS